MTDEKYFEEQVFPKVLANEVTCRIYLKELKKRGCKFSIPLDNMTHEECQNAAIRIYATIKLNEKKPTNNSGEGAE